MDRLVVDCTPPAEGNDWAEPTVVAMTDEEESEHLAAAEAAAAAELAWQWDEVRRVRGAQLSQTDWLASKPVDVPDAIVEQAHANEQAWLDYRQALRDLPTSGADPTLLVWPKPPPAPTVTISPPPSFVIPEEAR